LCLSRWSLCDHSQTQRGRQKRDCDNSSDKHDLTSITAGDITSRALDTVFG
jgi:hypothetical protein